MSAAALNGDQGSAPAAALSVLVHVGLFVFLFFGVSWQSKLPDAVVVELWDRPPVVEPPRVEPPAPRVEPKPEPLPAKPEIAVEREKKPPKKEPVKKEPVKKEPPKKEPVKKEPPREEPPLKFNRDAAIREQLAREMNQVARPDKPVQPLPAGPVIDKSYANKIKATIKANIVLPFDMKGNPEAIFDVVQLPTGDVISVRLRTSSANRAYDEAVERAILKSSPLPRPDRPEQFSRELQLKFRPLE